MGFIPTDSRICSTIHLVYRLLDPVFFRILALIAIITIKRKSRAHAKYRSRRSPDYDISKSVLSRHSGTMFLKIRCQVLLT